MWFAGLGDGTTPPGTSSDQTLTDIQALVASLAPVATGVIQMIDQQKLLAYNLKLIAAGKTPLTADQLAQMQAGFTPTMNVGLSSSTQGLAQDIAIGAGVLVGAILLVNLLSDKRRSYPFQRVGRR